MLKISRNAVAACLLMNMSVFTYGAMRSLFALGDLTVPEAAIIYPIEGLLTGRWPLYRDFGAAPYGTTPYTPLYYLICAFFSLASDHSVHAVYIISRFLTLLSTFAAAFTVQAIYARLQPGDGRTHLLALLLPFTILTLTAWGFSARPDMMAVCLSLTGIYLCLRSGFSKRGLCLGAVMMVLAFGCKQSFIAAPCTVFLSLLCEKAWRRAGIFALAYSAAAALLIAASQYMSGGWFSANIITANLTTLRPEQLYWLTVYGYFHLAPFVMAMALLGCITHGGKMVKDASFRCIALYLLISVMLCLAACLKEGAYFNYMLEPLFAGCAIGALGLQWCLKTRYAAVMTAFLLPAALLFSYHSYWVYDGAPAVALGADIPYENSMIAAVIDKVDSIPGDILVYNAYLALRSHKTVLVTDLFNARYLEQNKKLSTSALAERIERRELGAVVAPDVCQPLPPEKATCQSWPESLQQSISENYAPRETVNHQVFWYPKDDGIPH